MKIAGRFPVDTKPNAMWAKLHDVAALRSAIPKCRSVIEDADRNFVISVGQTIAPMLGPASARLAYDREVPPTSLDCTISGSLSMARFAGQASIRLEPLAKGTAILVEMDIKVPVIVDRFFGAKLSEKIHLEMMRFFNRLADHSRIREQ